MEAWNELSTWIVCLFLAAPVYLAVPVILRLIRHKKLGRKQAIWIVIANSVGALLILSIISSSLSHNIFLLIWGFVSFMIMAEGKKQRNNV